MPQFSPRRRIQRELTLRRKIYAANKRAKAVHAVSSLHPQLPQAGLWFLMATILASLGVGTIGMTLVLNATGQRALVDSLMPVGVMLLATSSAPCVIGIVRLLDQSHPRTDHCGRCQFYHPAASTYQHGTCGRTRNPTMRLDACDNFTYSERAMVRDRFCEAAHVLNTLSET
jgi:hypothetical protein